MSFVPLGYMAKRIAARPEWLDVPAVRDIYSVSPCISENFCDYVKYWRHNGFWLFDSPATIQELANDEQLELSHTNLFYYEAYEFEFDAIANCWRKFVPEQAFSTEVSAPSVRSLVGFDVATFSQGNAAECSPLSCNHLASEIEVNQHCLLNSWQEGKTHLDGGRFDDTEPGPFRIIAVYQPE